MTKDDIANFLVMNPDYLEPVEPTTIPENEFRLIKGGMLMKACYNNALNAAINLNGNAVILGVAVINQLGFPVEHAWIEMSDGRQADPTFQSQHGNQYTEQYAYYSLYRIPKREYLTLAKELSPRQQVMAIDITTLRRWERFQHLFNNHVMRDMYNLAMARHAEKKAQEDS